MAFDKPINKQNISQPRKSFGLDGQIFISFIKSFYNIDNIVLL